MSERGKRLGQSMFAPIAAAQQIVMSRDASGAPRRD